MQLKLEYGKQYLRRDGVVTDLMRSNSDALYKFSDRQNGELYTEFGEWVQGGHTNKDLVSEYIPSDPRRYDLAKDCLLTLIGNGTDSSGWAQPDAATQMAVAYADLLLEKLGEGK
jgi:hypothetical protein